MRKFLSVILLTVVSLYINANPVSFTQAKQKAEMLLRHEVYCTTKSSSKVHFNNNKTDSPTYYIFNASNGKGFAIVSGEDRLQPIVGYSENHQFPDNGKLPEGLSDFLNAYAEMVEQIRNGAELPVQVSYNANYAPSVAPMLVSQWGQGAPYNLLCPTDSTGAHCPTGCVATAISQIMYYWKWPEAGMGTGTATFNGSPITGSLEHAYDWGSMLPHTADFMSQASQQAVSQLMYDAGLAVNMTYTMEGSGAYSPMVAMYRNFSYVPTTLRTRHRECYSSDEWINFIKEELNNGRLIYHAASSPTGGGDDAAGHAFVIDGYNESNYLHVNWGWDGYFDGYYDMAQLNPGQYKFTDSQEILTGIQPARNGETGKPISYPYLQDSPSTTQTMVSRTGRNPYLPVTVSNLYNVTGEHQTWTLLIAAYNTYGNLVSCVNRMNQTIDVDNNNGIGDNGANLSCAFPSTTFANGDYVLRIMVIDKETGDSILPETVGGLNKNALYINLSSSYITVTDSANYLKAYEEYSGTTGIKHFKAPVYNQGDVHTYSIDGRMLDDKQIPSGIYIRNGKKFVKK